MSSFCYDSFEDLALRAGINLATGQVYVMLTNGYVPNQGAHQFRSDVTGEVTGAGYTAGGVPVAAALTKDTVGHREVIQLGAASIQNSTISATRAVYYLKLGGPASADPLIAQDDFGGTVADTNNTFSLAATQIALSTAA